MHAACASSLSHGLSVSLCPSFPHELSSIDAVTVLLQYSPTRVAVPSPYYLLINTTRELYSSRIQVVVPASFAAYQLLPFTSSASSSSSTALLSVSSVLLSAAAAVPLLALLLLTTAMLLAQSGHVQPSQVAAALTRHRLGLLLPFHRLLTPVIYHPAHLEAASQQPSRTAAQPPAAAETSSSPLMSPSHVLFQRKAVTGTSQSPRTTAVTFPASPPRRHSASQATVSSEAVLPLSGPLSLVQLPLRHSKSLSLGSGEMMMKEAMREKRRRRDKDDRGDARAGREDVAGRQGGGKSAGRRLRADGGVAGGADSDGDGSALLRIASPPKTRRTMSVGSSGPIFFRFDRVVAESDDEQQAAGSSDDSRTTTDSDASSRSGALHRDSSPDEERTTATSSSGSSSAAFTEAGTGAR